VSKKKILVRAGEKTILKEKTISGPEETKDIKYGPQGEEYSWVD